MSQLWSHLRELISTGRYLVSVHAAERLEERGILEWQVVAGTDDAVVLSEHPGATPNPLAQVRIALPDGTEVKAVWSWVVAMDVAKLVTVHYFDET